MGETERLGIEIKCINYNRNRSQGNVNIFCTFLCNAIFSSLLYKLITAGLTVLPFSHVF